MDEEVAARMGEEIERLAALVRFDYERTLAFIQGVVGVSANLRTIGIGGWFLLIAAAINNTTWELAAVALGAIIVFGALDAYHGWLYITARDRARDMEGRLRTYGKWLRRSEDKEATLDALSSLGAHQFGQLRGTPAFKVKMLGQATPRLVYHWLYPALMLTSVIVGLIVSDLCIHI